MIGLDFGSTTSSAVVARACVGMKSSTGRLAFQSPEMIYRSEPVFTPFHGQFIDQTRLEGYLDQWIAESGVDCDDIFSGGAMITGLAAKRANADTLARLIGEKIGESVIAAADDPCLESWLSFMGSSSRLSRCQSETRFINLDIGGGTTNPALGLDGDVIRTGCYYIGARHFQMQPGTYRLEAVSYYGRSLLSHLSIAKEIGDILTPPELNRILAFYVNALEAIVSGDLGFFSTPLGNLHQQVPFRFDSNGPKPVITFSGGVGELIYRCCSGEDLPGTTHYGDLGIDLARKILDSAILSSHVKVQVPENMGRATVYGLALHSTEISGTTIFLSRPGILPRRDLPILARISIHSPLEELDRALALITRNPKGGCIQILSDRCHPRINDALIRVPSGESLSSVKGFGQRLARLLEKMEIKTDQTVALLAPGNYGQALGNYASRWRQANVDLVVIDEIPDRNAHFVNIGRPHSRMVPVSFYGIH